MEREPTGDLSVDLVGAWSDDGREEEYQHPVTTFAGAPSSPIGSRVWLFRDDGTGHMWFAVDHPSGSYENDTEFDWRVDSEQLVVDDLEPATVSLESPSRLLVHPTYPDLDRSFGVGMTRCEIEVPEGVRGLDA